MKDKQGVIGAVLASARIDADKEVEDVHAATGLAVDFITKLESGDYASLSHDVYTAAAVRRYARFLGLDESDIEGRYMQERGEIVSNQALRRVHKYRPSIVTSSILLRLLAVGTVFIVAGYLTYQVIIATGSPRLNIIFPSENQVVYSETVELVGTTNPNCRVTIAGDSVSVADDGSFVHELVLSEGTHLVLVEAENDMGRTSSTTRTFVVEHIDDED